MPPSWDVGLPPPVIFKWQRGCTLSGNLSRADVFEVTTPVTPISALGRITGLSRFPGRI
jgi:hypothetical protein